MKRRGGGLVVFGRCRGCGGRSSQQHPAQGWDAKGLQYNYLRDNSDAFQADNGVYGASAAGYRYGHALSSSYSSTGSVGYRPKLWRWRLGRTARDGVVVWR
jgi:hypothetical protein